MTIGLVGDGEPAGPCVLTNFRLLTIPDREDGPRQLSLGQRKQEIRLVLCRVGAAAERVPPGGFIARHPRVVTGGDGVGPKAPRPLEQRREFQIAVTVSARQGSAPAS